MKRIEWVRQGVLGSKGGLTAEWSLLMKNHVLFVQIEKFQMWLYKVFLTHEKKNAALDVGF